MGLDITAYSRLLAVGKHEKDPALNEGEPVGVDDSCYYEDHVQAYAYDSFPNSFRGIPVLGTKQFRECGDTFLQGGCYATTDATKTHRFGAGSYGGYGVWRRDLARQFNPSGTESGPSGLSVPLEPDPEKPFYELIWFADNEGTIGPDAAKDLLADFIEHASRYNPEMQWADHARGLYTDWIRAFELAADGGLVSFR